MTEQPPYACTLTPQQMTRRAREESPLRAGLRGHDRGPDVLRLRFDIELLDEVRAFVREESACCAFFDFDIATRGDHVQLTVGAPPAAAAMLDALLDAFDGERLR